MKKDNKGFTLIELIIVIAILGIIALIAIPNLAGIRQRSQVSADKRTAEQIGKAVRIWATDVDAAEGREIPKIASDKAANTALTGTELEQYDLSETTDGRILKGLTPDYISASYTADSLSDTNGNVGKYYVSSLAGTYPNNATQKIAIGISLDGTDLKTSGTAGTVEVTYDGTAAGWAYLEK